MQRRHILVGTVFWLAAIAVGWISLHAELGAQSTSVSEVSADIGRWATGQKQQYAAEAAFPIDVALNDPVLIQTSDGDYRQAGLVRNINNSTEKHPIATSRCEVVLYDAATDAFPDGYRLEYYTTSTALDWVIKTMIPDHRRREIAALMAQEWQLHQKEVLASFRPLVQEGIQRAMKAVEAELPAVLKAHQEEFRALGDRYETEILRAEILPLVKEEILPIVEEEARPLASEIARNLWSRVSVWSFTWRFLYDKSPLPERERVKTEFQRFVNEEAIPELRSNTDEFVATTERIIERAMENPKVKEAIKRNLRRVAEDPDLHRLLWTVVREVVLENQTLRSEMDAYWKSRETQYAVKLASATFEPTVREIGDMIFGTREKGITPEFSRVLRSQILTKDRRWFVLVADDAPRDEGSPVPIEVARQPLAFPLRFGGTEVSALPSSR